MKNSELDMFEQYLLQKRYSPNTVKTYRDALRTFIDFMYPIPLSDAKYNDLERFNTEHILKRGLSASYQNQVINALKLYYKRFKKNPWAQEP